MHLFVNLQKNNLALLRIVSLVPSQTELLFHLGLKDEVVGITKFCVHPNEWFKQKTRIGGTKNINISLINSLAPNLILANKEENTKEQIEALMPHYPVYISDIKTIEEAYTMITDIGALTRTLSKANEIVTDIKLGMDSLVNFTPKTALYLIWKKPYMCAGTDTFIQSMLLKAGFTNICKQTRYPALTEEEIIALNPAYILLSTEPYPFKQKDIDSLQLICPNAKIVLVDGEIFSWYGSRMLHTAKYFSTLRANDE